MRCIAAPVFNSKGEVVGALGVSGPITRSLPIENISDYVVIVKKIAQELSSNLGYSKIVKQIKTFFLKVRLMLNNRK